MNPRALLDADMHTIGQWLLQGWQWWIDELSGLVPARLRRRRASDAPRFTVRHGALVPVSAGARGAAPGMRITLVVPAADCLVRTITRPAIGERDLQRMIAFEADTLLPLPSGSALLAAQSAGPAEAPGTIRILVAGLPTETARAMLQVADGAGVVPVAVILEEAQPVPLDFAPAMRVAGLLVRKRSAAPLLWGLVCMLLLINIAMAIWRDAARVARFEQIVAEQQPAVGIAQAIARRGEQDRHLATRSLALRRTHDPLHVIAAVSDALPEGAWLQRLVWDGETVRLTGYRPARADVATALRRSGRFTDVRAIGEGSEAAVPAGEPFDLSARAGVR